MMEDYFLHFWTAWTIPIGWFLIVYPFARYFGRYWRTSVVIACVVSFILMVGKEFVDSEFSVNDVVSDFLGVFFGTASLSFLFANLEKPMTMEARELTSLLQRKVSLRDLLAVGARLEERGKQFYLKAASVLTDPEAIVICELLAKQEMSHQDRISSILKHWVHREPDHEFLKAVENIVQTLHIFSDDPPAGAFTEDILKIALANENKTRQFYESFKKHFDEPWKIKYLEEMISDEKGHEEILEQLLHDKKHKHQQHHHHMSA